jgi:uncharacterized protein YciI
MPHFLMKLLPSRPTFATDMTEAEMATMKEHAAYWTTLVDAGSCVTFGPVYDPSGIWGLGIVEAGDEAAARKLSDADPAVTKNVGRYEIVPMRVAAVRKS